MLETAKSGETTSMFTIKRWANPGVACTPNPDPEQRTPPKTGHLCRGYDREIRGGRIKRLNFFNLFGPP